MDRSIEKKLAARAVELGRAGEGGALAELAELLLKESAEVRRLAASAIGKLAGTADSAAAVAELLRVLRDPHPQVRQYAVKALSAYGMAAEGALSDLRDMAAAAHEKEYNRRDASKAIETITQACRVAAAESVKTCQRCGVAVDADEFARSRRAFDRVFCDACFDQVYLQRRNFDTKVELNKTIRARDGTLLQSDGERLIADWLHAQKIAYRYDERIRIVEGYAIRPDFYLPEFDVYIEYWGMDTTDYKIGMLKKTKLYQQEGKRLISLSFQEKDRLADLLREKLGRYVRLPVTGGTE
ncbi:MAG: HEAT repeat domain-containing protein [Deltaproteobacteria bacterium]|nr:HEAT repeat domain-containing protein [Deltaproteobacteria bacterium]